MEELQIWTLYSSNRIGTALVSLGIILSFGYHLELQQLLVLQMKLTF